jgi:hypothetical protein
VNTWRNAKLHTNRDLIKEQEHIAIYHRHNQDVREYFLGREDVLLEVCWEEGDGWDEVCTFLNKSTPDQPLPHEKKGRSEFFARLSYIKNLIHYTILR